MQDQTNRETKEVITPFGKHKVILKTYITGREQRAIDGVFLEELKMKASAGGQTVENISGSLVQKAQDKTIEMIIVSVDDKVENILDTLLDMCSKDFSFVLKQIDLVTKGDTEKKTT